MAHDSDAVHIIYEKRMQCSNHIRYCIPDQFRGLGGAPLKFYTMWYHDDKTSDAALIGATARNR